MRLPADRRRQILRRIESLAADPSNQALDVRPLAGGDLFRLRIGAYRVLFGKNEDQDLLTIELIRTRGDVYKR